MPVDLDRLIKLLGMLGSAHQGEVLSAARMAHNLLKNADLTWSDVIQPAKGRLYDADFVLKATAAAYQRGLADAKPVRPLTFPALAASLIEDYEPELSEWEMQFLVSWRTKRYPPTAKQREIFENLADRFGVPLPG